MQEEACKE